MVHLEVGRGGGCLDLSEPQAFKSVSLQMIIDKTFTFYLIFYQKLHHIQDFDVQYEWLKWKRKWYLCTASSFRFQLPLSHPYYKRGSGRQFLQFLAKKIGILTLVVGSQFIRF